LTTTISKLPSTIINQLLIALSYSWNIMYGDYCPETGFLFRRPMME